jgi:hypothetical protein
MTRMMMTLTVITLCLCLTGGCRAPEPSAGPAATSAPSLRGSVTRVTTSQVAGALSTPVPAASPVTATASSLAPGSKVTPYPTMALAGEFLRGEDAVWPTYIPSEIPPLMGDIDVVMPGADRLRMRYVSLTESDVQAYLDLLASLGYTLEYLYYVETDKPDTSAERMARGEYDAVGATLSPYALHISYGAGSATLDIDATPFAAAAATAIAVTWPVELAGVPPPERCGLVRAERAGDGFHILCQRADADVDRDYEALLEASGFAEKSRLDLPDGTTASVELASTA